jgi:O-antigen ligase
MATPPLFLINPKLSSEKIFSAAIIIYQLALLFAFLLGFDKLLLAMLVLAGMMLFLLPLDFWFGMFVASLFIFYPVVGQHLPVEFFAYAFGGVFITQRLLSPPVGIVFKSDPLLVPILVFLGALAISLINAFDHLIAFKNFVRYLLLFGVYWVLFQYFHTSQRIERGLKLYLFFTFAACAHMMYSTLAQGGSRRFGLAGVPLSDLLVIAVLTAFIFYLLAEGNKNRWLLLSCFLFLALILTQTRGVWLSAILTVTFLIIVLFAYRRAVRSANVWLRLTIILAVATFCIVFVAVAFPIVVAFIRQKLEQFQGQTTSILQNSLFSRVLIWTTAWEAFRQNPVNGIGIDMFPYASFLYFKIPYQLFEVYVKALDPHHLFLAFLCETGVIGAAAFLLLLLWNLRLCQRSFILSKSPGEQRLALALWCAHFLVFVSSFYAGSWFYGQNGFQFILLLAMSSALYRIRSEGGHASH